MPEIDERTAMAQALRDIADHLEATPELEVPSVTMTIWCWGSLGPDHFATQAKALGGQRTKIADDEYYFDVERKFGPIGFRVRGMRDKVCERVKVGSETTVVQERAGEDTRPVVERTVTVDQYEWQCPDSVLS